MKQGRPSRRWVRLIVLWAGLVFPFGFGVVLEGGASHATPERIPRDKVIHPIMRGVLNAEVLPETRVDPVYPEKWRKLRLGAQVILQVVIDKSGNVTEVDRLSTRLRVETDSGKDSGDTVGKEKEDQVAPPEATRDFESGAISAVKKWKFRPGTQDGVPVSVYQTLIIDFTLCPKNSETGSPPVR